MPDGKRKRRFSSNVARRTWYAAHRQRRFAARLWGDPADALLSHLAECFGAVGCDPLDVALAVLAHYS